jgi:hypothetical protein
MAIVIGPIRSNVRNGITPQGGGSVTNVAADHSYPITHHRFTMPYPSYDPTLIATLSEPAK